MFIKAKGRKQKRPTILTTNRAGLTPCPLKLQKMMSKIMQEAKKLIESYDGQGWEAKNFEFDYDNHAAICDMKHENGNKLKLYIDYHTQIISVYINGKLKDQTKLK